ncbi:hypothetical protein GIB67_035722 [Kingdonia uniflora]|uniref:Uncharacterized protein n=1 Tax=Kingdonia uniflora TaxID=39325 RepID=A0A7J7M5K1_9MAGN|nr:hypothetical protein GIB67_035722 [Kingdonia uniflora]
MCCARQPSRDGNHSLSCVSQATNKAYSLLVPEIPGNISVKLKIWALEGGGEGYKGPKPKTDWVSNWVSKNDDIVRSFPIYVGGLSLLAVLLNRAVSGIAPVADASR